MDVRYFEKHSDMLDTLSEDDRQTVLLELEAQHLRDMERDIYNSSLVTMDNKGKMMVIKRWYPRAFFTVQKYFPAFVENPNDFPIAVSIAVNNLIGYSCGRDAAVLRFS